MSFANARYRDMRLAFLYRSGQPLGRGRLAVSMCVRGEMKYVRDVQERMNYAWQDMQRRSICSFFRVDEKLPR